MISFIRSNIPFVDAHLLQSIQDVISTVDLGSHSPSFISHLEDRRRYLSIHNGSTDNKVANQLAFPGASWRQQIRFIIGEMMTPDHIIWADEEDLTDHCFAQRALHKIKDRFEM